MKPKLGKIEKIALAVLIVVAVTMIAAVSWVGFWMFHYAAHHNPPSERGL